ncbi:MAG TPA: alpha/beta family hydrolase [Chryseolinea sp.]|nr:alpha/beta family hydrolase [Chryseolinea sp.]
MDVTYKISVSDNIGEISAIQDTATDAWCSITLAHGAGAGMTHSFMSSLARELSARGINTLRFNFPFTEAKKKRPDFAPVAEKTVEAVIRFALEQAPALPLFVSGKSFGSRMSSQYLSKHASVGVKGLVFFGFPLHAAGEPSVTRAEHLRGVNVPMLFLQGTKDTLARLDLIQGVCESLPLAKLQTFEGSDHAFMRGKKSFVPELAEAAEQWLRRQCEKN